MDGTVRIKGWDGVVSFAGRTLLFLLLLVVMLDPSGSVLHAKNALFVLFLLFNVVFYKPEGKLVPYVLAPYVALVFSFTSSQMLSTQISWDFFLGMMKGFSMLFLLPWIHHYNVTGAAKASSVVLALVVIALYVAIVLVDGLDHAVWYFAKDHNNMIMIAERSFLGVTIYGMNYSSIITTVLPLYLFLNEAIVEGKRKWRNGLCAVLLIAPFLVSGSRSTMLLPFVMVAGVVFMRLKDTRYAKLVIYPAVVLGVCFFVGLVVALASETSEESNFVKFGHLLSYREMWDLFPQYFILGQGTGAWIYSSGFRMCCPQTEWTYIELLRWCGVSCVFIFLTLLYPLAAFRRLRDKCSVGVLLTYAVFLIIAGTNPLIVSSTGMAVILMAYSYVEGRERAAALSCKSHTGLCASSNGEGVAL